MARRVFVRTKHILEKAAGGKEYLKTVAILHHGFVMQTEHSLDAILDKVESRITKADADDEEDDEELTDAEKRAILHIVKEETDSLDSFIDTGTLVAFYVWAYNKGGENFLRSLGVPLTFDLKDKETMARIEQNVELLIKGLDQTTHDLVATKIQEGIESGLSTKEVADSIREWIPETYSGRAETITRTETSRMVNAAQFEAASQNGAMGKIWVTQGADDECADNEDQGTIGMDESFSSGDDMPPAHPNCRCDLDFEILDMGYYWSGN